ncbi:amidohydrolase family protein [uncultured Tenacibaculum sp.]|uniref:amidohydrolase family protein n=1 Tax=uncultured Tenacibaculum sp. TaxID=174713 RepID=UPI002622BE9B|nr:amidohydrolase family protein [uncultured Tenacibaculum sp.]
MKKLFAILLMCLCVANVFSQELVSQEWTSINQVIPLSKVKEVRFTGFLKQKSKKKKVFSFLWMRTAKEDGEMGWYSNSQEVYKGSEDWEKVTMLHQVTNEDVKLYFGAVSFGEGDFYYDDFKLEIKNSLGEWKEVKVENNGFEDEVNNENVVGWKEGTNEKEKNVREFQIKSSASNAHSGKRSLLMIGRNIYQDESEDAFVKVTSDAENVNSDDVLITNVNYVDVINGKTKKGNVLVKEGKIVSISKKGIKTDKVYTIDGTGKWLIPGLVDAHIHMFQSGGLYTRPDVIDLTKYRPYEKERKWLRKNAPDILKRYLKVGVTSVIDVGGPMYNFKLRNKLSDTKEYPNFYLTGPLISTYQPAAYKEVVDAPILKAMNKEEAVEMVRNQLEHKPDFIKIWYIARGKAEADKNYDIVKATIDEGHKHGLKVAVHATQLHTAKLAVKAGADILVHSVDDEEVDDAFVKMLKEKNVVYVPTMIVGKNYQKSFAQEMDFSAEDFEITNPLTIGWLQDVFHVKDKNLKRYKEYYAKEENRKRGIDEEQMMRKNLKKLNDAGVVIATGTDAGNIGTLHASSYYDEIEAMKKSGLSNIDIIKASTINGARVLGKDNMLGSITKNKIADMVLLNSNPTENLEALKNISHIIKAGRVYTPEKVIYNTPEQLAQQQLNAYNAGDIEAFLAPYSEDVEIYTFPNTLTNKGKDKIRPGYKEMFEKYPNLHCELVKRIVNKNTVIDHERITGIGEGSFTAIAIYKIENGKIAKVYFVRN